MSGVKVCSNCTDRLYNLSVIHVFSNEPFTCTVCGGQFKDGAIMDDDTPDNLRTRAPIAMFGHRQEGKTTWLIERMDEYESISSHEPFIVVVPTMDQVDLIKRRITEKTGFIFNTHYITPVPNDVESFKYHFEGLSAPNLYVDEIHNLEPSLVDEIAMAYSSFKVDRLFYTKKISSLDLLIERSDIKKAKRTTRNPMLDE